MVSEFLEPALVNRPFVQECVSCLVRGLLPWGVHTISKLSGSGERHSQAQIGTALDSLHVAQQWTEMINGFARQSKFIREFFVWRSSNARNVQKLIMFTILYMCCENSLG